MATPIVEEEEEEPLPTPPPTPRVIESETPVEEQVEEEQEATVEQEQSDKEEEIAEVEAETKESEVTEEVEVVAEEVVQEVDEEQEPEAPQEVEVNTEVIETAPPADEGDKTSLHSHASSSGHSSLAKGDTPSPVPPPETDEGVAEQQAEEYGPDSLEEVRKKNEIRALQGYQIISVGWVFNW